MGFVAQVWTLLLGAAAVPFVIAAGAALLLGAGIPLAIAAGAGGVALAAAGYTAIVSIEDKALARQDRSNANTHKKDGRFAKTVKKVINLIRSRGLKIGKTMQDGSIFVGISPDSNKKMFVMPSQGRLTANFHDAVHLINGLNKVSMLGHNDWRLPSMRELEFLSDHREEGALKGIFLSSARSDELSCEPSGVNDNGTYWSSKSIRSSAGSSDLIYVQSFRDNQKPKAVGVYVYRKDSSTPEQRKMNNAYSMRLVRYG